MKTYRDFTSKEEKWIKDFEKVMAKAPDSLFMFVGSGSVVIYPLTKEGRYMSYHGGVDPYATSVTVSTKMDCDGGDW